METFVSILLGLIMLAVMIPLYFLPTIIAYKRKDKQLNAIVILNLCAGWTLIGWVGALVWSFIKK